MFFVKIYEKVEGTQCKSWSHLQQKGPGAPDQGQNAFVRMRAYNIIEKKNAIPDLLM